MNLHTFCKARRSYKLNCEGKNCLILSEWCTLFLLRGGHCHTYIVVVVVVVVVGDILYRRDFSRSKQL